MRPSYDRNRNNQLGWSSLIDCCGWWVVWWCGLLFRCGLWARFRLLSMPFFNLFRIMSLSVVFPWFRRNMWRWILFDNYFQVSTVWVFWKFRWWMSLFFFGIFLRSIINFREIEKNRHKNFKYAQTSIRVLDTRLSSIRNT